MMAIATAALEDIKYKETNNKMLKKSHANLKRDFRLKSKKDSSPITIEIST
jgi:hypothetical protein